MHFFHIYSLFCLLRSNSRLTSLVITKFAFKQINSEFFHSYVIFLFEQNRFKNQCPLRVDLSGHFLTNVFIDEKNITAIRTGFVTRIAYTVLV